MRRRNNAGYSLIEVLVAIAITSVVLLTIVTLFYVGRRNVYAGKQRTYAVSVGTRVLEDLSSMMQTDVRSAFVIDDNTGLSAQKITGVPPGTPGAVNGVVTFDNSIKRDTTTISASTELTPTTPAGAQGYLTKWKALIPEDKLANAVVGVIISPRLPKDNNSLIESAQIMKIRVYVQWDEVNSTTHRFAFFDTTKIR